MLSQIDGRVVKFITFENAPANMPCVRGWYRRGVLLAFLISMHGRRHTELASETKDLDEVRGAPCLVH